MSVSDPFVNRTSELNRMRNGLRPESDAQMYTVSGPSGFGKTALLEEFAVKCESEEIPVIWYEIGDPDTVQIFFQRLLETWEEEFPDSVIDRIKEELSPAAVKSIAGSTSPIDPSGGIGSTATGAILAKLFNSSEDITTTIDPVSFVLDIIGSESRKHEQIAIIVDQYDVERLGEKRAERFDAIFREIARDLPENVTWYIGSSRHIPNEPENILRVAVGELDDSATETLVHKRGFSPEGDVIGEIYNRTRGHPFVIDKLLKLADNDGLENILNDSPLNEPELIQYLESSLLNQLSVEEEQLLRDSCVLRELRPHLLSEMTDRTSAEVRQLLSNLHQRAIVKRRVTATGETVFRCHDLQRDYIIENESPREKRRGHLKAAQAFLIHAGEFWNDTNESVSSEEKQTLSQYLEYMANFDYQLGQVSNHYGIDHCIEQVLSDIGDLERTLSINAIEEYYSSGLSDGNDLDADAVLDAIQ